MDEKQNRITELEAELARIKEGIKRVECTMIVDGNDMYDWGWSSAYEVNTELFKRGLNSFSWVGCEYTTYDWQGEIVYQTPPLSTKIYF